MNERGDMSDRVARQGFLGCDTEQHQDIQSQLKSHFQKASENLAWLYKNMPPYFFITMKEEVEALVNLATSLHNVPHNQKIVLTDRGKKLIVARMDIQGSVYDTLKALKEREISYAELTHSNVPVPGTEEDLEVQRFEFGRKTHEEILQGGKVNVPGNTKAAVTGAMKRLYPKFDFRDMEKFLRLLFLNNESYVRVSPPERIARSLWLYQQGGRHDGLYLDVELPDQVSHHEESRLLFSVANPQQKGFITQVSEVFQRLEIGVRRSYSLNISTGVHIFFLGTFYVCPLDGSKLEKDSNLFRNLKTELYNTQILSTVRSTYTIFVADHIMTGEEALLTNTLIAFCHTSLAHNQPDRFDLETVKSAFHSDPDITLKLISVFKCRFDPDIKNRQEAYEKARKEAVENIDCYNTGHRYLDEIRKTIFRTCLYFIHYTLKTNFFVPEKHALSFRLDPAYLRKLGPEFTSDLPSGTPFRVTFFFGRHGIGYHIGFSDIARGGWRTIICTTQDEYTTNTNTLFREVFVLAHTQHLKNKDIYEGGSKMTVVLDAEDADSPDATTQRLHKLQYGFLHAFLDIFVTVDGKTKNPRVVDYYGEEEPIELGPDENLHDETIEHFAEQSVKRGYLLGIGIISSKKVGINHKEYGVTSRGVIRFAEIAMQELGINMHRNPFTVKITGGTNGDVAGNAMELLLDRCPRAKIRCIVAGAGALYDPEGIDRRALRRLVLKSDVVDFDPRRLHPGGTILFRHERRRERVRELHRELIRTPSGVEENWITPDEFHRKMDDLTFNVEADLFLPCGGRPETIDGSNWEKLFSDDGTPRVRVISEGANSYITPGAREEIQRRGVVILRDVSANKCGVITSSYEIIANLLMTEKEFLTHKKAYVSDVLAILDRRAEEEANLIFKRYRENHGTLLYTQISLAISTEINEHYARLFALFQSRPELLTQKIFRTVLLSHLPAFIRETPKYRRRVKGLPTKIQYAILASEIASFIVYRGGWEGDFANRIREYLKFHFS